jgi:hypothetical protein
MRATQKKRISQPVSRMVLGKNALRSTESSLGHPRVEKGKSPEENHVSSTSLSYDRVMRSFGILYRSIAVV